MPYELLTSPRVEKEFRKFPAQIRTILITETLRLAEQPKLGEQLKGKFRAFRSLHIKIARVHYRVVYEIIETQKKIHVHAVGIRENFYIRLDQMRLKPIRGT